LHSSNYIQFYDNRHCIVPPRSKSDPAIGASYNDAKIGKTLIQMGDKYRDNGEIKRAVETYNLARAYSPREAQERLSLMPQWSLSSESNTSTRNSFGEGYHRAKVKKAITGVFKRLSSKPSLTGPFFPKGTHQSLPPLMSQDALTPRGTVCTFDNAQDINSVVTSYINGNEKTKSVLRNQINEIISQFDNSFISLEAVQELVILAKIPDRLIFLHVITQMLKVLKEKPLLASIVLQGMAVAINFCPEEINMDDMQGAYLDILRPLKKHLETVRSKKNEYQLIPLLFSLSALLNAMVCKNVSKLDRKTIFNPLVASLKDLESHDDTTVVFLAFYAEQALAYIGNNESLAMSIFRRGRLAIAMAGDIANGISSADLGKFVSAYDNFTAMCDFSVQDEWYPGLAYVDCILEQQNWPAFEEFVLQSKLKSDECFLQGICLRLEQIAATQQNEIHHGAIKFLQTLASSSIKTVQKTANAAIERLGISSSTRVDSKDTMPHMSKVPSVRSIPQAYQDNLPPVWDSIWHTTTRSTLLIAVQQKERTNANLDEMPGRLDDIDQSINSGFAQTSTQLAIANGNIGIIMENIPTQASLDTVQEALRSYYEPSLFIQRVSGKRMDLVSCYINLAIVEARGQREKDKQGLRAQEVAFQRMSSYERIEGTNLDSSIPLDELFNKRELRNGNNDVPKTVLIHGRAGIGKTTLCKKLVHLSLNGQWRDRFDAVLWLPLRELKFYKSRNLEGLLSEKYFSRYSNLESTSLARTLFSQVQNGKVLFVLDGLDELQAADDPPLDSFLTQLLSQQHIVITSRPSGVDNSILSSIDLELETVGFNPMDIRNYLRNVVPDVAKAIEEFIDRTPIIQGLVNIPVQLDAICFSWDSLPSDSNEITMTRLYQVMVRKLWCKDAIRLGKTSSGRLITEKQIQGLSPYKIDELMNIEIEFLGYIAFKCLKNNHQIVFDNDALGDAMEDLDKNRQKNDRESLPPLLLDDLKQTSFLHSADADLNTNAENLQGSWHFLHLTFQEYFAATWLVRHLQTEPTQGKDSPVLMMTLEESSAFVREYKYNPRYEIVWWMVAGQLEGETLVSFFELLQGAPVDLIGGYHHHLLAACLKEGRSQLDTSNVGSLEIQLERWLQLEMMMNESSDGTSILGRMSYFPEELLIRNIDQSGASRKYLIQTLVTRASLTQSAIEVLHNALQDEDWTLRRTAIDALEKKSTLTESTLQALIGALQDGNELVRISAVDVLGKQSALPESILQALVGALQHENKSVRNSAARALGMQSTFPESILQALVGALQHENKDIRSAADALEKQSTLPESILQALVGALKHKNKDVRSSAARTLGMQSTFPESILQALIDALQDDDWDIRNSAADALGNKSTLPESTLQVLIGALRDENEWVRRSASNALGKQSTLPESILQALIGALQDGNELVRSSAVDVLGKQSTLPESTLPALVGAMQDENKWVRSSAADALGKQSTLPESTLQALIGALQDENWMVRNSAARVLENQSTLPESTLQALIGALQDENENVRRSAADALGNQSTLSELTFQALIGALQDEDENVRYSAADALGNQSTLPESALQALVGVLQDENWDPMRVEKQSALPGSALQALIGAMQYDNKDVRSSAVDVLGNQSTLSESALQVLIGALQDENDDVRSSAAYAVEKQSTLPESILQALVGALRHENKDVRSSAVDVLGNRSTLTESTLQALIGALKDEDHYVRISAAYAVGKHSALPESALQALISSLQDENEDIRSSSAKALGNQSTLPESALQAL
ncbi:hypothetical protein BGZ80_003657, partial [Entomortierella chlamydospora]